MGTVTLEGLTVARKALTAVALIMLAVLPAAAQSSVSLAWDAPDTGANGYLVQVSSSAAGTPSASYDVAGAQTATIVFAPGTYYAVVRAYFTAGNLSAASNEVTITVAATPPPPPPTDPCMDPLKINGLIWPASKRVTTLSYTSTYPTTWRFSSVHGSTVEAITFTETTRACPAVTVAR